MTTLSRGPGSRSDLTASQIIERGDLGALAYGDLVDADTEFGRCGTRATLTPLMREILGYQSGGYTSLERERSLASKPTPLYATGSISVNFALAGFVTNNGGGFAQFSSFVSYLSEAYKVLDVGATEIGKGSAIARIVNLKRLTLAAAQASCPNTDFSIYHMG